ncbi:hypothetical protein IVB43_23855 [Bradyrhizobium sp. 48]|uniref:hypothetical protein n=1 Tax=Bradyrhizobium sp. 48 TaxID=2782676 RepID=UPI001FFAC481|nr:hypothetical protein [Bradyrhizobium sp. 48]MCK1445424.1 hypothetical protein [Bradyrhizobium sp. 48]
MSTTYKVDMEGRPTFVDSDKGSMMVRMWDLGPLKPEAPEKPKLPEGKEGTPAHDLAMIDFDGALATYRSDLKAYGAQLKDFEEWHKKYQGPYEIEMFSIDAREAMAIAPDRYMVSDDRLDNHGLPKGRKPGKFHAEEKQRIAEASRARARELARDPVFGQQEIHA